MKQIMGKQQLIGILTLLLVFSQVSTETKQELSSPAESDQGKSEQTTAEETSDPANDDVTDPDPLEDAKMDPEEMPDLGKEDLKTEPASDDVANDAYSSLSKTVILCENAKGKLRCPVGTTIYITAANYGRTTGRSTCPHSAIKTTNCKARSSLAKVRSSCQNKRECDLSSSNSVFGDPCVGTYKYLQVSFRCRLVAVSKTKIVCEGRSYTLTCPAGRKLKVEYANYGRTAGRIVCPSSYIRTIRCTSSYSNRLLRCACHGQARCYLQANNAVFGDPCFGTHKYIEIRYKCI